jgi:SagB-type dehydrogenase family enzyme
MQWKYQSMVYAVILKNVGALYQTLYLAATAMGLAPTALGGGDSDRFARATGRDYWGESLVGEFLVGARP